MVQKRAKNLPSKLDEFIAMNYRIYTKSGNVIISLLDYKSGNQTNHSNISVSSFAHFLLSEGIGQAVMLFRSQIKVGAMHLYDDGLIVENELDRRLARHSSLHPCARDFVNNFRPTFERIKSAHGKNRSLYDWSVELENSYLNKIEEGALERDLEKCNNSALVLSLDESYEFVNRIRGNGFTLLRIAEKESYFDT